MFFCKNETEAQYADTDLLHRNDIREHRRMMTEISQYYEIHRPPSPAKGILRSALWDTRSVPQLQFQGSELMRKKRES